ncbi:MAG: glycosyltransferase family 4 protein, partial [Oscillospiraceae bacterium]
FSVIQTRFYTESIFAARFCHKKNIPSIVIEHGTAHLMRGGVTGVLGNIYEHFAFWLIRKYSKEIYGVSKCCCQWLTHFGVNTDKVLYNAVEPIQLEKAITEKAMRTVTANIPPNIKTVICFSGRFIPEKGVIPLVKAFNRLRQIHPATVLLMAGNGPLFESVKALDTENVILLGAVDYPTSLAVFKRSDIFCLPTFSEGFATTVLEAAALNTAILTTPTGGSPELIIDANHGYLFDGMDEETIYIALCKAVSDIIWCKTASANAKLKL